MDTTPTTDLRLPESKKDREARQRRELRDAVREHYRQKTKDNK